MAHMIPKYVFDTKQTRLDGKVTLKDTLMSYRKLLYKDFKKELKNPFVNKLQVINVYKLKISEVDYELQSLKIKEISK